MNISRNGKLDKFRTSTKTDVPDKSIVVFYNPVDLKAYCQRSFGCDVIALNIIGSHLTQDEQLLLTYLISDSDYSYDFIASVFERLVVLFVKLTKYLGSVYYFKFSFPGHIPIDFDTQDYYDKDTIGQLKPYEFDDVISGDTDDLPFVDVCLHLSNNNYNLDAIADIYPDYYDRICTRVDMTKTDSVCNIFKMLRLALGLSQVEFAKKYHINPGTYIHWEQGTRKPPEHDIFMLKRLAYADIMRRDSPVTVYDCINELALDYGNIYGCPVIVVNEDGSETHTSIESLADSCPETLVSKYEFKKQGYSNLLKIYIRNK